MANTGKFYGDSSFVQDIVRQKDWSESELGDPQTWPTLLQTTYRTILNSPFPLAIYWGPRFLLLYNEPWSHIPAQKHPWALGRRGSEVWSDIWQYVGKEFDNTLQQGNSFLSENAMLPMVRKGYPEECYFDYTFSPIFDAEGNVLGILNAGHEITADTLAKRRNDSLNNFVARVLPLETRKEVFEGWQAIMEENRRDFAFGYVFRSFPSDDHVPKMEASFGIENPTALKKEFPLEKAMEEGYSLDDPKDYLAPQYLEPWTDPCGEMLTLYREKPDGVRLWLILGLSPALRFNQAYLAHARDLILHLANSLTRAKRIEAEKSYNHRLREQETLFARMANEAPVMIWLADENMELSFINETLAAQLDINLEKGGLLKFSDFLHPEDLSVFQQILQEAGKTGQSFETETRLRKADGTFIWVLNRTTPRVLNGSRQIGFIGSMTDISSRKEAETALRQGFEKFKLLAESLPQMVWTTDAKGQIQYVNRPVLEYSGFSSAELITENLQPMVHPDDQAATMISFSRSLSTGEPYQQEHRFRRYDGEYHWHLCKAVPVYNASGAIDTWVGSSVDIQEQRLFLEALEEQVEQRTRELRKEKQFAENILDSSVDIIAVINREGRYIKVNGRFESAYGKSRTEVEGKLISEVFQSSEIAAFQLHFQECLDGDGLTLKIKEHSSTLSGRLLENYFVPLVENGKIDAIMVIGHDITEIHASADKIRQNNELLEMKNQELESKNQELASFAYISSHDLQEPLRKIQAFASMLLSRESENLTPDSLNYIDRLINAAQQMRILIDDLLAYSRTNDTGQHFEVTNLNRVVSEVLLNLDQEIAESKAKIHISELPTVSVIPFQMRQLFSNLLTNALKFTRPGETPVIDVNCTKLNIDSQPSHGAQKGQYYMIEVRDQGIGFDNAYQQKIFEIFQRLHGKSEYPGTGIGLAICKKIAERHQGFIEASSVEGEGASFRVYLPVKNK